MSGAGSDAPKLAGMKYLVEAVLHSGDIDTVMRIGDQNAAGKQYALKIVKRGEEDEGLVHIERARVACEASRKLGSPTLLRYHDFVAKKSLFRLARGELLMEYVAGKSLDQLEQPKVGAMVLAFAQVATALGHMHRRGVFHGDLSPSHVLLARNGQVKVFGYGLSLLEPKWREQYPGTKPYMAPEQGKSRLYTAQADVYGLGATMYHVLCGQPPSSGMRSREEGGKIPTPIALNPKINTHLSNLIVSCLQSESGRRPADAAEVKLRLDEIAGEMRAGEGDLKGLAVGPAE